MKTKIFFVITISVFILSSCLKSEKITQKNDLDGISWKTEKLSEYQLVRPIDFREQSADAYHLPLKVNSWYLISRYSGCYLLPVKLTGSIENAPGISLIDTIKAGMINSPHIYEGLNGIKNMEIMCFKNGISVRPQINESGEISAVLVMK